MIAAIQQLVRTTDAAVARLYLSLCRERNAVVSFLFHSLFADEAEIRQNLVDPLQRTTVAQFRQVVEYYLEHGYRFVGPAELLGGLDPGGKYAVLTFDDGYYNNARAAPVLDEFRVPAFFFISTENVAQGKCFWWDVLHRERSAQGASQRQIYREGRALKDLRTEEIEARLTDRFGPDAFRPRGDVDRPFTPAELRAFAASPYVHVGNHSANHAILTNYTPDEVRTQVGDAQTALREMTGVTPTAIGYPNGAHTPEIVRACGDLGLRIGFTTRPRKARPPLGADSPDLLCLGRFCPDSEGVSLLTQCRTFRSDLLLYAAFREGYLRLRHGTATR